MNNKKYTIKELTLYYVERYSLNTQYLSSSYEDSGDGLGTYITALTRIMKKVSIGEMRLWDLIKPNNKSRQITIPEFERHCFDQWAEYIKNNCDQYAKDVLSADEKRIYKQYTYFDERKKNYFEYVTSLNNDDDTIPDISPVELSTYKNSMMLKAIFELFFTPIDDHLLYNDLYQNRILKDESHLTEADIEVEQRLENPEGNYYRRKKDR